MMTGRMAAKRSEWDGERARCVFEEANARYEASKHIGARFRGTRTDVRFWHKADISRRFMLQREASLSSIKTFA